MTTLLDELDDSTVDGFGEAEEIPGWEAAELPDDELDLARFRRIAQQKRRSE